MKSNMHNFFSWIFKNLIKSIAAGICIGIGGVAYLMIGDPTMGSLIFGIGLFTICISNFYLFTGKDGYILENHNLKYGLSLILIWIGNYLGTVIVAAAMLFTSKGPHLVTTAYQLTLAKSENSLISLFVLGIFCNILMFIAIDNFKNNKHIIAKYIGIFLCVMTFILCGFEHSVADMFYYSMALRFDSTAILNIIVITLGNLLGSLIIPLLKRERTCLYGIRD